MAGQQVDVQDVSAKSKPSRAFCGHEWIVEPETNRSAVHAFAGDLGGWEVTSAAAVQPEPVQSATVSGCRSGTSGQV